RAIESLHARNPAFTAPGSGRDHEKSSRSIPFGPRTLHPPPPSLNSPDPSVQESQGVNVAQVAAEIFKREGVKHLFAYPLNALTESCAAAGIHPVIVRQERAAGNIADAVARMTSGETVPVVACQHGPGVENLFGAIAQAYSEGVPMVVVPADYARNQ